MAIFNLISLAVWRSLISFMLRFKLATQTRSFKSGLGLESSCVGRRTIENLCYSDSLHVVQLVMETPRYHHYANIMELIRNYLAKEWTIYIHYILGEENSCADILAKLKSNNSYHLVTFNKPLPCLSSVLQGDVLDVFFSRT